VPKPLPAGYFSSGVWAATGPLRLRRHTCVVCGHRSSAWVTFQAHRRVCAAVLAVRAELAGPALDPDEPPDPGPPGPTLDTPRRAPVANRRGPRRGPLPAGPRAIARTR
jgi:hypothetical protein